MLKNNKKEILQFIKNFYDEEMYNLGISLIKIYLYNDNFDVLIHYSIPQKIYNIGFGTICTLRYLLKKKFGIFLKTYDIDRDNIAIEDCMKLFNEPKDIAELNINESEKYYSIENTTEYNLNTI